MRLDDDKVLSIRNAHDKLNELIVGDSWGIDSSQMVYSDKQIQDAKKEYSIIENYLEDLRFSLYK